MNPLANLTRPAGDPKVLHSGPTSLGGPDKLARAMGWFSFGLGALELLAPRTITRALGMEGHEGLVRAYGAREFGAGMLSLSLEKEVGLWSRAVGDVLDIATVLTALRPGNRKRDNVVLTLLLLGGVTAVDVMGAYAVGARHRRSGGGKQQYRDRSGFPKGIQQARGAAKRETPRIAHA